MNRVPLVAVLLAAACAPAAHVSAGGSPTPAATTQADAGPTAAPDRPSRPSTRVVGELPPRPKDAKLDAEVDADVAAAADSAADAEALEQLASARPALGDEDASGGAASVTWDIDVTSFNNHDRVQYYLDFFTGPGRSRMHIWLQRLPRYEGMIRARLAEQGLPEDLVYLALIESGFSNRAVSHASAVGMWQFMAGTGRGYGLRIDSWVDDRRDPVKATRAAARHLKDLRDRFGSPYLAAAAYNAGAGRVGRGLARLDDDGEDEDSLYSDATFFKLYNTGLLRRETKDYVPKLIAAALIAKEPARYGFTIDSAAEPFRADSIEVPDMTGLDVIARLADTTMAEIRDLNPEYLRLVTPPRVKSIVLVPAGQGESTQAAFDSLEADERVSFHRHVVGKNESVKSIARNYGVTTEQIYEVNPGRKGHVRAGQTLVIPSADAMSLVVARNVAEPATPVVRIHRVRSGETLSGIAARYHVRASQIQRWNGLRSSRIRIGQRLRLGETSVERARRVAPSKSAASRTHVVRSGETLIGVAKRYHVSVSALSKRNGLSTRAQLKIGQRLRIPG